jgi:pyruvate decarboxylase
LCKHVACSISTQRADSIFSRFILNNGGYTVERLIHGKTEEYNDVAVWDYSSMAKMFGPAFRSQYHGPVKTNEDLVRLIESSVVREGDCLQVVELSLAPLDAPKSVLKTGAAIDEFNKQKGKKGTPVKGG